MVHVIRLICILLVSLLMMVATTAHAKKYKAINEIPGQVPETEEEKSIWDLGRAHQQEIRQNGEAMNDVALEAYLESIVHRLLGDMVQTIDLEVDVIAYKDTSVNAWVYPNGTVAVHTGMLAAMQNEAQLAAILAHELSHYLNRHAFIQIKSKQKNSIIGKGLGVLATAVVASKTGSVNTGLIEKGQIWTELVTSGYSRKLELAADKQGMALYLAAGYPADQALPGFETLRIPEDDVSLNTAKIWSSHPDIDSRLKNIRKQIKKAGSVETTFEPDSAAYYQKILSGVLVNSQLQVNQRDYQSAINSLALVSQHVDDATTHFLLGEAYRKQSPEGTYEKREAAYLKAVQAKTSFVEAHKELGLLYRQQGKVNQARDSLEQYIRLQPTNLEAPIVRWYLANLQVTDGGQ